MSNSKTIDDLPNELLLEIFSYVPVRDIVNGVENVCCRWNLLVKDTRLWKHLVYQPTFHYALNDEVINVFLGAPQLRWFVPPPNCCSEVHLLQTVSILCKNIRAYELWTSRSRRTTVERFVRECKHLEKLTVHDQDFSQSWGLKVVSKCSNLKSLILVGQASLRKQNIFLEISNGCPSLECLDLKSMIQYDIDDLEYLLGKKNGRITSIALRCCIHSQGCALPIVFKHCPNLELLDITGHVGDRGKENLTPLQKLPLKTLCMTYVESHNIVKYFENGSVRKLVKLDLKRFRNFDRKLANLIFQNCTSVKHLNLEGCEELTGDCLESISNLKYLEYLNLDHCIEITDIGVKHIVQCKYLKFLVMNYCPLVSSKGFALCCENLKMLRELLMKNCIVDPEDLLKVPENLTYLKTLRVFLRGLEKAVILSVLKRMPKLDLGYNMDNM